MDKDASMDAKMSAIVLFGRLETETVEIRN